MDHIAAIEQSLKENLSHAQIVRKIYLTYPTAALVGHEERQFQILNSISSFYNIPISHVHVCGSSKTGRSFHKKSVFIPRKSDFDIAIIDSGLFIKYSEIAFSVSDGYLDRTKFSTADNGSNYERYVSYISRGIFRPDLMPSCKERSDWFKFFNQISVEHSDYFKSINAGIYQSQLYFEHKQSSNIKDFINKKYI